jgi:uncharacterized protein (DUF4213/DUF364 family)
MSILSEVITSLPDGKVEQAVIGAHWTAVVAEANGSRCCGLASNLTKGLQVDDALHVRLKELEQQEVKEVCAFSSGKPTLLTSVGVAAVNALLPHQPERWVERNAGEVIAEKGKGKRVALVGHFPFVPELREQVGRLDVLELRPREGDIEADQAPSIIPQADIVAITSMAYINGTMDGLLDLCSPEAYVIVLGPSTPLSPRLFEQGIDMLCGSIVEQIDPVVDSVIRGDHFRAVKKAGVRLVTIEK